MSSASSDLFLPTWSSQLPRLLAYYITLFYFLCIVLSPVDQLLNYVNNAGMLSQLSFFLSQLNQEISKETYEKIQKEVRVGGGGQSKCWPTSKILTMIM